MKENYKNNLLNSKKRPENNIKRTIYYNTKI
jgi:hypothetical protein